jgi:hypothetical protein
MYVLHSQLTVTVTVQVLQVVQASTGCTGGTQCQHKKGERQ